MEELREQKVYHWCPSRECRMDEVACDTRLSGGKCKKDKKGCREVQRIMELSEEERKRRSDNMKAVNARKKEVSKDDNNMQN